MTSQGSPYGRFRHALDTGNATIALAAAADLPHVGLNEALELCLILCDQEPERFQRAAVRWHGRYCREFHVQVDEAQAVLGLLGLLQGPRRAAAAHALADLLDREELSRASEALNRWAYSASRKD